MALFSFKQYFFKTKSKRACCFARPNGESTLFSIITGLARADEGECFINGNNSVSQHKSTKKSRGSFSAINKLIQS